MIFVRPYDPTHEFETRSKAANLNVTLKIILSRDFTIGMTPWRFGGSDQTADRKIRRCCGTCPPPDQSRDRLQIRSERGGRSKLLYFGAGEGEAAGCGVAVAAGTGVGDDPAGTAAGVGDPAAAAGVGVGDGCGGWAAGLIQHMWTWSRRLFGTLSSICAPNRVRQRKAAWMCPPGQPKRS